MIWDIRYLFFDEVQELTPVALSMLRELTRGAMVMAGEVGQSICNYQWPFVRTDIQLRGTTRILKTNFRNTIQVHTLVESFRKLSTASLEADPDRRARPFAFREGPDSQNLCILVPRNKDIENLKGYLEREAIEVVDISSEDFSFRTSDKIRISTLRSSVNVFTVA